MCLCLQGFRMCPRVILVPAKKESKHVSLDSSECDRAC